MLSTTSIFGNDQQSKHTSVNYQSFVDSVEKFHPEKSINQHTLDRTSISITKVGRLSDPELAVGKENINLLPQEMSSDSLRPMWGVELKQMFPWPGTLDAEKKAAASTFEKSKQEVRISAVIRRIEAKRLYLSLIYEKRKLDLDKESFFVAETVLQSASTRLKYGVGSHHEVIQAENEKVVLEINLQAEKANFENHKDYAAQMMGREDAQDINFDFSFPAEATNSAAMETLDLGRSKLEAIREESNAKLETERKKSLPKFMLSGSYMKDDGGMNKMSIMAGISIPIFSNGIRSAVDEEFRITAAQTTEELSWHEKKKKLALLQIERRRTVLNSQIQGLTTKVIPNSKQHLESLLSEYGQGKASFNSINQARKSLLNYQKNHVVVESALYFSQLSQEKINAGLFDEEFAQNIPKILSLDMASESPMEEATMKKSMPTEKNSPKNRMDSSESDGAPSSPMGGM